MISAGRRPSWLVTAALAAAAVLVGGYLGRFGLPFVYTAAPQWTIGFYEGNTPLDLEPMGAVANPVLTAADVTDARALFVADPFFTSANGRFYLFFEVMNRDTNQGDIGLAVSDDLMSWHYDRIVLDEPFHLSFPQVFEWNGNWYMLPEAGGSGSVRLYRAEHFPEQWQHAADLLTGCDCTDTAILHHGTRWWLFSGRSSEQGASLYLHYAYALFGPYVEHSMSPVISQNRRHARMAGRIVVQDGVPIRFAQDTADEYGLLVRAFEIRTLSPTEYSEDLVEDAPVVGPGGEPWNAGRMHHIDAQRIGDRWIAAVDGRGLPERRFGLRR
jgi:hypothetical protein